MVFHLRRLPALAYVFLACSLVGALVEVTYHFLPPEAIPAYAHWLAGLSPADRDFFGLAYELIAHIFVALGLMGLIAVWLYEQMKK